MIEPPEGVTFWDIARSYAQHGEDVTNTIVYLRSLGYNWKEDGGYADIGNFFDQP